MSEVKHCEICGKQRTESIFDTICFDCIKASEDELIAEDRRIRERKEKRERKLERLLDLIGDDD